MKALQFSATGDLAALSFVDVATPVPAAGEVLVQIKAAGLNPSDVKNVLGRFPYTTLPRIPGRDFAGVGVEAQQQLLQPRKKLHSRNRKIRQYMMKTVTKLMLQKQQKTEILYMTKMETRLIRARLQQKQLQKTVEVVM